MKLRLRSLQSKETLKLDVPNDCTIQRLKELLSRSLSITSSLRLSLNGKDELSSPSPDASLRSIGITSGDLIYYEPSPAQRGNDSSDLQNFSGSRKIVDMELDSVVPAVNRPEAVLNCEKSSDIAGESVRLNCVNHNYELLRGRDKGKAILVDDEKLAIGDCMDVDRGSDYKRLTEPNFLKRIFSEGIGNDFSDTKLIYLAVHAVFLEFGFVGFDSESGLRVDNFDVMKEQTSRGFSTTVSYTLPELLSNDKDTDAIVLKFHTLGHFVNVFGSSATGQVGLHKLSINKSRFVPAIGEFLLTEMDSTTADAEKVVSEFWKFVKDGLALPLMIDICEKGGLALPPCFTRLPAEMKFRILELLPGQDIARMARVCKEMCSLSSNNELWKAKCISEFGREIGASAGNIGDWRAKFVSCWESSKKWKRGIQIRSTQPFAPYPFRNPERVPRLGPNPFGIPPMRMIRDQGAMGLYDLSSRAPNFRLH